MKKILVIGASKKAKRIASNLSNTIKATLEVTLDNYLAQLKIQSNEYTMIFISSDLKTMTGNTLINFIQSNNKSKNKETPARLV